MAKQIVHPKEREAPMGVWSPAIEISGADRLLFVSGITSRNPDGTVHAPGDMEAQTRRVCENLQRTVEAANGTLLDVVSVLVHVTDIEQFDTIHRVRREFFPEEPPTSTMVQVSRLVDERSLIEMTAVAALPVSRRPEEENK